MVKLLRCRGTLILIFATPGQKLITGTRFFFQVVILRLSATFSARLEDNCILNQIAFVDNTANL